MSSGGVKFLQLIKPFMAVLPEVAQADRKVPFREKVLWTALTLFSFFGLLSDTSLWNTLQ
jgi:hypothetical protein